MTNPGDATFEINTDICAGHGRCYSLAPQWFDSDDIGYGVVTAARIPAAERAAMEDVAGACPEGAITIRDAD
jgi:ferredoxin